MGEAGRRWALERFSPEAMVARYAALYKEIAS
jgi:glycosyltransferase involved in cell wall biosynthesis